MPEGVPGSTSTSTDPYVRIGNGVTATVNSANGIAQEANKLDDKAWVTTGSGIPAVEPNVGKELFRTTFGEFQEGVAGSDAVMPKGVSLKLNLGAQAQSPVTVGEGQAIYDTYKKDGTLPTVPGANANGLAGAKIQLDTPYVSVGVEGLAAAAASATSNPELVGKYNQYVQSDLKAQAQGFQTQINTWQGEWNKPENKAQMQIIQEQSKILGSSSASAIEKMQAAQKIEAAAKKLQPLLSQLNTIVSSSKGLMEDTGALLAGTKDGMRSASVDMAAGGVIQGKVTGRVPLPSPTPLLSDLTLMGQVKVIYIPKNPTYDPSNKDYPQFKYTLGEVKMMAQVTLNGVEVLQKGLEDAQALIGAVEKASKYTNNPTQFLTDAMTKPEDLAKDMEDLSQKTEAVNQDLKAINQETSVKIDLVAKAVSPTSQLGVGSAVGISGTIAERARVAVVLDNVVGYIPGKEETWKLGTDKGGDLTFTKVGEKERNVYHDFFPLTLKAMAQVEVSKTTKTEISTGVEHRFGGTTAVYAGVNQPIGNYVRLGVGGMYRTDNTGLVGGGLSIGPKDKWSLDLTGGVNPVNPGQEASAQVGFKVHF